ncbi:hypothetical protein K525DRAFT_246224, partial [Schizophyllum commune Loenen D]
MDSPREGGTPRQLRIRPVLPSLSNPAPAFPAPSSKRKSDSVSITLQEKRHRSTYIDPFSRPGSRALPSLSRHQSPPPPHPPQTYEGLPPLGHCNLASNSARITQQPPKPTPLSNTFAAPSSISRAISDKIAPMQNELDDVKVSLTRCASAASLAKLQHAVGKLSDENAYLREQNEDLEQRLQQLIDARTADSETLTVLAEHVRALEGCAVLQPGSAASGDPAASAHEAKPQVKTESDSCGSSWKAARQTLLMAMGQSTLASNEAVMQHYVDNEDEYSSLWGSWSTTSDGSKKLVPNFAQSWGSSNESYPFARL